MKQHAIKPLLAALLLAGSCAAQAAHFEVVGYQGFAGYSGELNGEAYDHTGIDLSQDGDVSFNGYFVTDDASRGYAADAFLQSGKDLWISNSQFVDAGYAYSGSALLSLPQVTLKIVSDGETLGSAVQVSFNGLAEAVNSFAGSFGSLTMDMAVTRGATTLGSFLWDASAESDAQQNVSFSFLANVGDEVTLSAFMESSLFADGSQTALLSAAGSLSGEFAIAAVPEPEQYALFLAGLGLMGAIARRRSR